MDFNNLRQWREQQQQYESEKQQNTTPSLVLCQQQQQQQQQEGASSYSVSAAALPLFVVPESESPLTNKLSNNLSAASPSSALPRMGGYLSMIQMQELELQALIYRHMVAGAAVPPELLMLVKRSLLSSPHFFLQHNTYPYYTPNWYMGRGAMDPEPWRCRRTDGKKWRCSRDVVLGQKYCERHIHRGRNRSRKPVESPTSTTVATTTTVSSTLGGGGDVGANAVSASSSGGSGAAAFAGSATSNGTRFSISGAAAAAAIDMFQLNQGLSGLKTEKRSFFEPQNQASVDDNAHNNRVLRCFFDDWPRSSDHTENSSGRPSSITLSMSATRNPSLDFLRLSTGSHGHEPEGRPLVNWWGGSSNHAASVGGPLAEALRSSTGSSPTSVLHQLQRSAASDTSFVRA